MPKRIQLRRAKGWRMPENTVKVDRSTKWGNPFIVGKDGTGHECVAMFRNWLLNDQVRFVRPVDLLKLRERRSYILDHIDQLRGCDLACWCSLCPKHREAGTRHCAQCAPCHADVLLALANKPEASG